MVIAKMQQFSYRKGSSEFGICVLASAKPVSSVNTLLYLILQPDAPEIDRRQLPQDLLDGLSTIPKGS
jgi:hypothetical protein